MLPVICLFILTHKDCSSWKGQGDWEEDWGEAYAGKRQPALFVVNINSGDVRAVDGIGRSLSVGQVVWAPITKGLHQYLVFVGWPSDTRKLGMKYCSNRPCALYAVRAPSFGSETRENTTDDLSVINLSQDISSAFLPRFTRYLCACCQASVVFYSDDMLDCDGVFSQCIVSSVDDYLGGAALGVVNVFVARSGDDGVRCPDVDVRSVEPSMVDWGDS
nr:acylamino-acid-releasing enzyme [Tanacetum cinerariifolium]